MPWLRVVNRQWYITELTYLTKLLIGLIIDYDFSQKQKLYIICAVSIQYHTSLFNLSLDYLAAVLFFLICKYYQSELLLSRMWIFTVVTFPGSVWFSIHKWKFWWPRQASRVGKSNTIPAYPAIYAYLKYMLLVSKSSVVQWEPAVETCGWPTRESDLILTHCPQEMGQWFHEYHFQTHHIEEQLGHSPWNCSQVDVTEPHWWDVNIGSGNGRQTKKKHFLGHSWPKCMSPYSVTMPLKALPMGFLLDM